MTLHALWEKFRGLGLFAVFGAIATVLETTLYAFLYEYCGIPNVLSAFIAWFLMVFFCFYTNKFLVYGEKSTDTKTVLLEFLSFFLLRSSTGILNMVGMFILVDLLDLPPVLMKFLLSVVLGFVNYGVGKLAVFREK